MTDARIQLWLAPGVALAYPFALSGFHAAVTPAPSGAWAWLAAAASLTIAFAAPALALLMAMRLAESGEATIARRLATWVALLAVASPPMFTMLGVVLYMFHDPVPDTWVWVGLWAILLALVLLADDTVPAPSAAQPISAKLRVSHGIAALAVVLVFLGFHIANHLFGLLGPESHAAVMKLGRVVYRAAVVEPVLVLLFLALVAGGLRLVWLRLASPADRFRTLQMASGIYLVFFVLGHMNSVFIFARSYLGIDTGWGFATGAPAGLIHDAWNIRLIPHYALGVFFVLTHLASGGRVVMMAHGGKAMLADRLLFASAWLAGAVALAIILGMCGMRLGTV
ncbi:MAG: hypothetical protein EPO23_08815 [Xanthobacteraceae bacterium]|nr:MAG: hypothetical protein EPO23_08815 [Xanthobacteraceae bacterium]